ncbi:MAG: DUF697 domain-containing protein, partial [Paracoccaceae bacterium]
MENDPTPLRRPALITLQGEVDPGLAAPVPDAVPTQMQTVAALATTRGSALSRFAIWAFAALFSFILSIAIWDFVTGLLARNTVLGSVAFALLAAAILAALILSIREFAAFFRLRRLDVLRERSVAAQTDLPAARAVVADILRLYTARPDTAWGRARLAERQGDVMDADALLAMAETDLLTDLDQLARREIEAAARRVAMVTALVPMALADVAMAL